MNTQYLIRNKLNDADKLIQLVNQNVKDLSTQTFELKVAHILVLEQALNVKT